MHYPGRWLQADPKAAAGYGAAAGTDWTPGYCKGIKGNVPKPERPYAGAKGSSEPGS